MTYPLSDNHNIRIDILEFIPKLDIVYTPEA